MNELNNYLQSEYLKDQPVEKQQEVDAERDLNPGPSRIAAMVAMAAVTILSGGCRYYLICEPCGSPRIQKQIKVNERRAYKKYVKEYIKKKKEDIFIANKNLIKIRELFVKIYLELLEKHPKNPKLLKDLKEMKSSLIRILNNLRKEKNPGLRMKYDQLIKKIEQILDQIKQFKQRETFEKDRGEE